MKKQQLLKNWLLYLIYLTQFELSCVSLSQMVDLFLKKIFHFLGSIIMITHQKMCFFQNNLSLFPMLRKCLDIFLCYTSFCNFFPLSFISFPSKSSIWGGFMLFVMQTQTKGGRGGGEIKIIFKKFQWHLVEFSFLKTFLWFSDHTKIGFRQKCLSCGKVLTFLLSFCFLFCFFLSFSPHFCWVSTGVYSNTFTHCLELSVWMFETGTFFHTIKD